MHRVPSTALALLLLTALAGAAHAAGPYYARGDYYAGSSGSTWSADAGNLLHDDGLHDDGAAGDGVYAGDVVSDQPAGVHGFKIANADWSQNWPLDGFRPLENARVWTSGPGDVVHFRLDTNVAPGWQPDVGVATDHDAPPGTTLELIGGDPELGAWGTLPGVPLAVNGSVYSAEVMLATAGAHPFRIAAAGDWHVCMYGIAYNMDNIGPDVGTFQVSTAVPGAHVRFEFDRATGRARAVVLAQPAGEYYVRGDFRAGTGATWDALPECRLFDDGQHGDGAAGDGVYGATIVSDQPAGRHEWKIATADWSQNWPLDPNAPLNNAQLWTTTEGEAIHFTLDTNDPGDGWLPAVSIACDHGIPPATSLIVFAQDAPGGPFFGVPVVFDGGVWRGDQVIETAGEHSWVLFATGADGVLYGTNYNITSGSYFPSSTPAPQSHVHFEWNPATGRGRALVYDPTPVRRVTWGELKARFR